MSKKSGAKGSEISVEEQQTKIKELRNTLGPLKGKLLLFCTDDCLARYLRARNWNVKKATKMLKDTLKWRLEYKPDEIRWEDIAKEAETGKIYRASYVDKYGRNVLVMRPGYQNTSSSKGQIKYLVYCMENAILNLPPTQEQMVWLVDFKNWNAGSISVKVTRDTAHVLQNHYPERLGLAIMYNPPRIFESFFAVAKPFLEPKTQKKVKFVYSDNSENVTFRELFDMDKVECAFGGKNPWEFKPVEYGERMKEDDKKMALYWSSAVSANSSGSVAESNLHSSLNGLAINSDSSDEEVNLKYIERELDSDDSPNADTIDSPKTAAIDSPKADTIDSPKTAAVESPKAVKQDLATTSSNDTLQAASIDTEVKMTDAN